MPTTIKEPYIGEDGQATQEQIKRAREEYGSDDIQIDDNARRADTDEVAGGTWIQAWVWLAPDEDGGE